VIRVKQRLSSIALKTISSPVSSAGYEDLLDCSPESGAELELSSDEFLRNLGDLLCVSPPMLDTLRSHPAWLGWLRHRNDRTVAALNPDYCPHAWKEWNTRPEIPKNPMDSLRAFKRKEYLEIAYRDLSGISSFEETVRRLSDLADGTIGIALDRCRVELSE